MLPGRRYRSMSPAGRQSLQFYNECIKWGPSANNFQCHMTKHQWCEPNDKTFTFTLRIHNHMTDLFSGFPPYFELVKLNPAPLKSDSLHIFGFFTLKLILGFLLCRLCMLGTFKIFWLFWGLWIRLWKETLEQYFEDSILHWVLFTFSILN